MLHRRNLIWFSALITGYMLASSPAFAAGADNGGTKKFWRESCNSSQQRSGNPACMGEAPQPVEAPPPVAAAPNTMDNSGAKQLNPTNGGALQ
jgi:hypothetical protein